MLVESALAAVVFFAANAVFGINTFMGHSFSSVKYLATALADGPKNLAMQIGIDNMRLPGPMRIPMDIAGNRTQSFCLAPEFGRQQVHIHVPRRSLTLVSNAGTLPYALDVVLGDSVKGDGADNMIATNCHGRNNVKVQVSLAKRDIALVRKHVFTDTVILIVDPE